MKLKAGNIKDVEFCAYSFYLLLELLVRILQISTYRYCRAKNRVLCIWLRREKTNLLQFLYEAWQALVT